MPLYEYRCQDCGQRHEQRRSYTEADTPATCPACEGDRSTRLLGSFACIGSERTSSSTSGSCAGCSAASCSGCRRS